MPEAMLQNRPLVADLVSWIAERPRDYDDVMTAWRTSCPQLTIWEDAIDAGLLVVSSGSGPGKIVRITDAGREFLRTYGRDESPHDVDPQR